MKTILKRLSACAVAVVAAAVASILFRVLIYQLGYSVFLLY